MVVVEYQGVYMAELSNARYAVEIADTGLPRAWTTVTVRLSIEGALFELRLRRRELSSRAFRIFDRQTSKPYVD